MKERLRDINYELLKIEDKIERTKSDISNTKATIIIKRIFGIIASLFLILGIPCFSFAIIHEANMFTLQIRQIIAAIVSNLQMLFFANVVYRAKKTDLLGFNEEKERIEKDKTTIDNLKDTQRLLVIEKESLQNVKLKEESKTETKMYTSDDEIIDYIKNLAIRCESLDQNEKEFFIEELKNILLDYTSRLKELINNEITEQIELSLDSEKLIHDDSLSKLMILESKLNDRIQKNKKLKDISTKEKETLDLLDQSPVLKL